MAVRCPLGVRAGGGRSRPLGLHGEPHARRRDPVPQRPRDGPAHPRTPGSALPAGTYRVDLAALADGGQGSFPPFLVTVPEGWTSRGGWALGPKDSTLAVSFWDVREVFTDSCRWRGSEVEPGPRVDDLVHLLVNVPSRAPTAPRPVEVGGRAGRYLEWSVPIDLHLTDAGRAPS